MGNKKQKKTRFQIPFYIKCLSCKNTISENTRTYAKVNLNPEKNEGLSVYDIFFKCKYCKNTISLRTNPKNMNYAVSVGCSLLDDSSSELLLENSSVETDDAEIYGRIISYTRTETILEAMKEKCTIQEVARRKLKRNKKKN